MNLQLGEHIPGGPVRGWQLGALFLPFALVFSVSLGTSDSLREIRLLASALGFLLLGLLVARGAGPLPSCLDAPSHGACALPGCILFVYSDSNID
jgi:hypothetical protein